MDLFDNEREEYILGHIGTPAALEQFAEECCELGQACLKMARKLRGQNPTPKDMKWIEIDLKEEMADVQVCFSVLMYGNNIVSSEELSQIFDSKMDRWVDRIREEEVRKEKKE